MIKEDTETMLPVKFHASHGQAIHAYSSQQITIGKLQPPVARLVSEGPRAKDEGYGDQGSLALYMLPAGKEMMSIKEADEFHQKDGKIGQEIFIGERRLYSCAGTTVQQTADHQQDDQVAVTIEPGKQRSSYNG